MLHASGTLADGVLTRQSPQSLRKALAAKTLGTPWMQQLSGLLPVKNLVGMSMQTTTSNLLLGTVLVGLLY